jgi:pimeloyl-ACP methyl ester carboxylesterase
MKPFPVLLIIILLISGQYMQARIINDSIPARKNFERAIFRLWYPDDLKVIHGIIVLVPGSNGDGRGEVNDTIWRALAERHGFALLGCFYTDYKSSDMFIERYVDVSKGSGQALIDVTKKFSISSGHPELEAASFLMWGHSAGGQFNYEFACWNPQRVIAFVVNKGGIYYTAMASKEARSVPAILFTGEKDLEARKDIIKGLFSMNRRAGALWIYAQEPESGHEVGQTERLASVFFEEIIPLRISDNKQQDSSQQLKPLSESDGIIGDHKSQTISPVSEGKKYDYPVSWFPGMKTAQAWIAFINRKPF